MKLTKVRDHLRSQGAETTHLLSAISNLRAALLLPREKYPDLSAPEVVTLLIGSTVQDPEKAAEHVKAYQAAVSSQGDTFIDALTSILEAEPADVTVTSVRICQDFAAGWIHHSDGSVFEFTSDEFHGKAYRREVVISGGLLGAVAMGLQHPTESGWKE